MYIFDTFYGIFSRKQESCRQVREIEALENKNGNKMTPQERQMNKELLQKIANRKKESLAA